MRKINSQFDTAFISEAGSFLHNKDYFAFAEMDDFACYVIADGIDDDIELESAKIAVTSIIRQFSEKPSMKKSDIKDWLETANKELLTLSKTLRLKASVTVVVTDYASMVYGLAGNTRFVLFREGALIEQSADQSLSNNLLEEGKISVDKIALHLERNNLYCHLGRPEGFNPEISGKIKLEDGDTITLLTRGIWENVDVGEMTDAIKDTKEPQEALNNVEDLLLSRQPENLENYTLAAIFVNKTYKDPGRRKALIKKLLYAAIPFLIILIIMLIFFYFSQERKKDQLAAMSGHIENAQTLLGEDNFPRASEEYKAALDLAKKLKLQEEQKNLTNYYKTVGLIVLADTAFQQRDLLKAAEKYQAALDASYYADRLGENYILRQQRLTSDYMKVTELLQSGDQRMERQEFEGARQAYLEAKVVASRVYFTEGRKEAADKLAKLGEQLAEDGKKLVEEGKKAKEQEASTYEQQGDRMAQTGDYEGAITMLSIAAGMYDQGGKSDKATAVHRKIVTIEDRMTDGEKAAVQRNMLAEAEKHEREGDKLLTEGDQEGALEQYGLALSLYSEGGKQDKTALLQKKIDNVSEKKRNMEKLALQRRAMDMEKEGDLNAAQGNINEAKTAYYLAQQNYGVAGLATNVLEVQKKLDLMDLKLTGIEQQKSRADAYVAEANEKTQNKEYIQAKYLYLLASDIYEKLGMKAEQDKVNSKLKLVDNLMKVKA